MILSSYNTNQLRVQNPFHSLWWSAAFPGAGHMMVGKFVKGFILFIWEFIINTQANINLAIEYSMLGKFEAAKACIDLRWFFLYATIYVFVMWDSYRLTTEVNQFAVLALRDKSKITPFSLGPFELNYLIKTSPWVGVVWSLFTPGLGHLISRNIVSGLFLMFSNIAMLYQSNLLTAAYLTSIGHFREAFAVSDSYYRIVEINLLFKIEQARHLSQEYCLPSFQMPL